MTPAEQLARIAPYVGRVLEDEYIQNQMVRPRRSLVAAHGASRARAPAR
jgi:hypothetical protein